MVRLRWALLLLLTLPLLSLTACSTAFESLDNTATLESQTYLSKVTTDLQDAGLSKTETKAITDSIQKEMNASFASTIEGAQSLSADDYSAFGETNLIGALPNICGAAVKALSKNIFNDDYRKYKALDAISATMIKSATENLSQQESNILASSVKKCVASQMKALSTVGVSDAIRDIALSKMIQQFVKTAATLESDPTKRAALLGTVAQAAISGLANTGLANSAIKSVIPKMVEGAFSGASSITGANSTERTRCIVKVISEVYANLTSAGIALADQSAVSATITTSITSNLISNTDFSNDLKDDIMDSVLQGDAAIESTDGH